MAKALVLFPPRDYSYNPKVDLQPVDQFGFVNLNECFEKGIVPSIIQETEQEFNQVMNPGTLISHAQDVFDGLRKAEYVKNQLSLLDKREAERLAKETANATEKVAMNVSPE